MHIYTPVHTKLTASRAISTSSSNLSLPISRKLLANASYRHTARSIHVKHQVTLLSACEPIMSSSLYGTELACRLVYYKCHLS